MDKELIKDKLNDILPLEVRKLTEINLSTTFERDDQEWWQVIYFTYIRASEKVHVLTIKEANLEWIYPLIFLGININDSVMLPVELVK